MENSVKKTVKSQEKTNPHNLVIGDRVHLTNGKDVHIGKVTNVYQEHDTTKVELKTFKGKELKINADSNKLEPLFTIVQDKKIPLAFTYNELKELFKKGSFKSLDFKDLMKSEQHSSSILALQKGDRTRVFEKVQLTTNPQEGKPIEIYEKDVRFELRRSKNNVPYVNRLESKKELDLTQVYGKPLTKKQQEQLKKTGNLGLLKDVPNKETGEIFNVWVAVDPKLKDIVTRPEWQVNIKKVRGFETTPAEQEALKRGEGISRENQYISINAASTSLNGSRTHNLEFAKKQKMPLFIEKKNDIKETKTKTKGVKM